MADQAPLQNPAKRKLAAGEFVLCMSLRQARTADSAMIAQACGFDAICVDREHSTVTAEATSLICSTALMLGLTPLVRVKSQASHHIGGALDGGALGVIVPHVNSRDEAEAVVRHAKFPPLGHRSVAALGPALRYRSLPLAEGLAVQNAATMVIAMLETPEGIANAEEIAAVSGVDMLLIGPNDLSSELGIPGQLRHPLLRDAYAKAATACRAHGKHLAAGGVGGGPDLADLIAMGARFIMGGTDVSYLMEAARQDVAKIRAATGR